MNQAFYEDLYRSTRDFWEKRKGKYLTWDLASRILDSPPLDRPEILFLRPEKGWRVVLAQRTPPLRAAAKRRRGLCQAGLAGGREGRSLRSPNERLTAERRSRRKAVWCFARGIYRDQFRMTPTRGSDNQQRGFLSTAHWVS